MSLPGDAGARSLELVEIEEGGGAESRAPYPLDEYVEWATHRACKGKLGRYQMRVLLILTNSWIMSGWQTYTWGFITVEPDVKPEILKPVIVGRMLELNGRVECNASEIQEWGDTCPELKAQQCVPMGARGESGTKQDFRQEWTYRDPQNSAKAEFDFATCSDSPGFSTFTGQWFWYGYAIGVMSAGAVSDTLGRKKAYNIFLATMALGGLVMAMAPGRWILFVGRFVQALGVGGFSIVGFVWASESLNFEAQHYTAWVPNFWFILGGWIPSLLTLSVQNWRIYTWIATLANLIFFAVPCCFHESPKWLAAKKDRKAVEEVMKSISLTNGVGVPEPPPKLRDQKLAAEVKSETEPQRSEAETMGVLVHPKVLFRLVINSALWFVVSFGYYGLSLFAPPPLFDPKTLMHADVLNWCFAFAVEAPAYWGAGKLVDTAVGRKGAAAGTVLIGGVLLLIAGFEPEVGQGETLPDGTRLFFAALYYVARMNLAAGFGAVYTWAAGQFPSSVRSTAMGACSFWARLGSSFAPLAGQIEPFSARMTVFAIPTVIVSSIALLCLPETRGKPLPCSVEDL